MLKGEKRSKVFEWRRTETNKGEQGRGKNERIRIKKEKMYTKEHTFDFFLSYD